MLLVCALKTSKLAAHLLCNLSQYWLTECLDFALSPIMQSSAANPSVPRSATKVSCLSCSQVSKRSRPPSAATPDAEKGVQGRAAHEAARQTSLPRCQSLGRAVGNGVAHSHAAPKARLPGHMLTVPHAVCGVFVRAWQLDKELHQEK